MPHIDRQRMANIGVINARNVRLKQEEVITAREANVLDRPRPDQISRICQCFMEVAASDLISGREINQWPLVVDATSKSQQSNQP